MQTIAFTLDRTRAIDTAAFGTSPGHLHPDRVIREHDLLYIQRGGWEVIQDGVTYDMRPGDALLLYAGKHHSGTKKSLPGTEWAWVHFERLGTDRYTPDATTIDDGAATGMSVTFPAYVRTGTNKRFAELVERTVRAHQSTSPANNRRARVLLLELLLELAEIGGPPESHAPTFVDRVVHHIEWNPGRTDTLDELAEMAGVCRRLLTREFRRAKGTSVRQHQLAHKVRLAKAHLQHSPGIGLKELAAMLGFSDEYHLSKSFKRIAGMTPSEFRAGC